MQTSLKWLRMVVLFWAFCFSPKTFAADLGFDALIFSPATDGGPYIGILGSQNRNRSQWNIGMLSSYAYQPVQLTKNGNRSRGILDHTLVQHLYGQYGLMDRWLSAGLDLPLGWVDFRDPNGSSTATNEEIVFGDITVNFKSTLLQSPHFGIALRPFLTLPTGDGKKFFGNGNVTGGGTLIAEIKPVETWSLALNAGIQGRESFQFQSISKDHQLMVGVGTALQITRSISTVAEVESETRLKRPFREKGVSQTEIRGGLQWKMGKRGLMATAGGTGGLVRGAGSPVVGLFAGILFVPSERGVERNATTLFKVDLNDYTIHFAPNSDVITDSENAQKLVRLADWIRGQNRRMIITGHASPSGDHLYNREMAQKRAEKTAWWLHRLGVPASDLIVDFKVDESSPSDNQSVTFSWE